MVYIRGHKEISESSADRYSGERCIILGEYIIAHRATVRSTAKKFGISKSTVHKDVTVKLRRLNPALYKEVKAVLLKNKSERHLRGGEATRQKYLKKQLKIKKGSPLP